MGGFGSATTSAIAMWLVMVAVIVSGLTACDRGRGDCELHLSNPYRVGEIEFETEDQSHSWRPTEEEVQRWVHRSLDESERGLSLQGDGMEMRATIQRRARVEEYADRMRLIVGIEAQLERSIVPSGAPMVYLTADVEYRHTLSNRSPSEDLLRALARTLQRRAVEDVFKQLRLRARIRQSGPAEVVEWINGDEVPAAERLYAIRRAQIRPTPALEKALVEAAADPHDAVAVTAVRTLQELDSDRAAPVAMAVAEQMSRDRAYERYLELLSILGRLDEPWISIYLETVADAHRFERARAKARELVADRPPPVQHESAVGTAQQ